MSDACVATSSSGASGSAPRSRCLASALAVVTFRNPFFSALALIGNLASLAVLYLLLGGEFVAAAQVLVYGGAVMVMFLFVIAYLGDKTDEAPWAGGPSWQAVGVALAAGAILTEVIVAIALTTGSSLSHEAHIGRAFGSPAAIGRAVPHRPPDRVRGDLDRPARRGGRRGRARLARPRGAPTRAFEPASPERRARCTGLTSAGTSSSPGCCS